MIGTTHDWVTTVPEAPQLQLGCGDGHRILQGMDIKEPGERTQQGSQGLQFELAMPLLLCEDQHRVDSNHGGGDVAYFPPGALAAKCCSGEADTGIKNLTFIRQK